MLYAAFYGCARQIMACKTANLKMNNGLTGPPARMRIQDEKQRIYLEWPYLATTTKPRAKTNRPELVV